MVTTLAEDPGSRFRQAGYLAGVATVLPDELDMLRRVCDALTDEPVDDGGDGRHRIGLGRNRRFLAHRHEEFPDLERFLLAGSAADVAARLLGDQCLLFNEQFVVKGADSGASFAWHQDSAYVGFDHEPYLSVWIALDDTTEENGCLYVLGRNLDRDGRIDPHAWVEETRELNGYDGKEQGRAIECRAGGIVVFSSLTLHRSGPNTTRSVRRAYLAQYSSTAIRDPDSGDLKRFGKAVAVGNSMET